MFLFVFQNLTTAVCENRTTAMFSKIKNALKLENLTTAIL
jgi:hypothetical protein